MDKLKIGLNNKEMSFFLTNTFREGEKFKT